MEIRKRQLIRFIAWLLIVFGCIYTVRSIIQLASILRDSPETILINEHDATGQIALAKTILGFRGDCTQVTWQVDNIQAIYYTDSGTVGMGERSVCSEYDFFTIHFHDGTTQTYPLIINYGGHTFVQWMLVAILTGLSGLWLIRPQGQKQVINFIWEDNAAFWQPLLYMGAAILIVMAGYAMGYVAYHGRVYHYHDSASYLELSEQLQREGLWDFNNISFNHLYVYPAFLAVCQHFIFVVLGSLHAQEAFVLIQYGLFVTIPAFAAASMVKRLNSDNTISPLLQLAVFALVQLNPLLISASREVFVETFNILAITLFGYSLITPFRGRLLVLSTMVALLIADKPILYWQWLIFFGGIASLYVIGFGLYHQRLPMWLQTIQTAARRLQPKSILFGALQIILPLLIVVGLQVRHVWNVEGQIGLYPSPITDSFVDTTLGIYSVDLYKYETYRPDEPTDRPNGAIEYRDIERNAQYKQFLLSETGEPGMATAIQFMLRTPLETLYTLLIRLMSSFQNYEWIFYRQELYAAPTYIFWWGFVAILYLVYSTVFFIQSGFGLRLNAAKNTRFLSWTLLYFIIITLIPPSVLIVSEVRRIWPILPLMTVVSVYIIRKLHWIKLAVISLACLVFYWHVLVVLQASLAYILN